MNNSVVTGNPGKEPIINTIEISVNNLIEIYNLNIKTNLTNNY